MTALNNPSRLLASLVCAALSHGAAAETLRIFFIGNSVTDTVRYDVLAKLAVTRGARLDWGRAMIPGGPLEWIYTHPNGWLSAGAFRNVVEGAE